MVTLDRVLAVTVTAAGTVLTNKTVAGDLIIAASVGEGNVTLKNITVEGDLIMRGGGADSVYLDGVTVKGEVRLEKENLHVHLQGGTKLGKVTVLAKAKLSGSGTIESLNVSVSGVTIDHTLTVRKTETVDGVKAPVISGSGSSSSSGSGSGGTVTPPAQQDKTVIGVAAIADIPVDYGTSEDDAIAKLPAEVTLNCEDGSTVAAAVTWTLGDSYNAKPETTTTCTATGAVTIPADYTGADTLIATADIIVRGGDKTVKNVIWPADALNFEVAYNTSEDDAKKGLPSVVQMEMYAGDDTFAEVAWERTDGEYHATPTADTSVTYTGTLKLSDDYQFSGSAAVKAVITVKPEGAS